MTYKIGFDNEKYLSEQTAAIRERIEASDNKLYLEFGGKLIFDYHASRVLPGFDPNVKMRLLQNFKDQADIIICIYAGDIERRKTRADFGITYDVDAQKLIDDIRSWDLNVKAVVITRYEKQPAAVLFKNKLERRGIKVYTHARTNGYPLDVDLIVSDEGYGANPYIETEKPLVVITAPGPGSGKLATCLSQLYHEHKRGVNAGYSKFETFPIWSIPLRHPVNVAYEAATADLRDFNLIDPHHQEAYGETAINYNRDVEAFPLLKRILEKITGDKAVYRSPTDMGVNRAGFGIIDDDAVKDAAIQEIIRRYFRSACEYAMGLIDKETVGHAELIMTNIGAKPEDRKTVKPARDEALAAEENGKGNNGIYCGSALMLPSGNIVTGKNSPLMHAASSLVLNAIKHLAGIPDDIHLLAPNITESIGTLKRDIFGRNTTSLDLDETLIALSIGAITNPSAQTAMEKLSLLKGCEVHMTHMPTPGDEAGLRRLGVNLTSDPNFASANLFV
ncbi:MAG: DUF1846 domain-containing protein [Planctomycetota bacterium]|jgi:uncharacterized protein (UPF0371 family)